MFQSQKTSSNNLPEDDVAIGIDLGTTNCCVAIYRNTEVEIIENDLGRPLTPSYVTIDPENVNTFVGDFSKSSAYMNPTRTIFDVKRLIGRKYLDRRVQNNCRLWPFEIVAFDVWPKIKVDDATYFPEEISAHLLRYLKTTAETFLGHSVYKAVISVPASFSNSQRQATKDAGNLAGLNVLRIINEPTAACIAYNFEQSAAAGDAAAQGEKNCLIFDFGGGTFDVAIMKTTKENINILAIDGHSHLGGQDIDKTMVKHCAAEFARVTGIDLIEERRSHDTDIKARATAALRRLRTKCEENKKFLCAGRATSVTVALDALYNGHNIHVVFTRELFDQLNMRKFERCIEITARCVRNAHLNLEDIDDIVLVGGSSKIPKLQLMLRDLFNGRQLSRKIDQDTTIAYGAAIFAAKHNSAAVQLTVSEVIPLPIGFQVDEHEVNGHVTNFMVLIEGNSNIPISVTSRFATVEDNQDRYCLNIYEGHGVRVEDNYFLGNFIISNLPQCPSGEFVDVTMDIDGDGILHVTANFPHHLRCDPSVTFYEHGLSLLGHINKENFEPMSESQLNSMKSTTTNPNPPQPPPPIPPKKTQEIYIALYDYQARTREDLTLQRGQKLNFLNEKGDWWMMQSRDKDKKGYVPKNYVAKINSVEAEPWFFSITREGARKRLLAEENGNGSFLIRISESSKSNLALSVRIIDVVKHFQIFQSKGGKYYIAQSNKFDSLHDLVTHYSKQSKDLQVPLTLPCVQRDEDKGIISSISHSTANSNKINSSQLKLTKILMAKGQSSRVGEIWEGTFGNLIPLTVHKIENVKLDETIYGGKLTKMKNLLHRNLLQFHGITLYKNCLCFVNDFIWDCQTLRDFLESRQGKSLEPTQLLDMATDIASGMHYLEDQNFVHGDLSPRNILMGFQNSVKISNFGLVHLLQDGVSINDLISVRRTAPEVLRDHSKFSTKSDIWSYGILLVDLVTPGVKPYGDMSPADILDKVCRKGYRIPKPESCSDNLYKLMTDTWHPHAPKRPSFQQVVGQLENMKNKGRSRFYTEL